MTKKIKIKSRKRGKPELSRTQSRYRFKEGFASKAKEHARDTYRKNKGKEFELGGSTVLRSLEFVEASAEMLPCKNERSGKTAVMPVIRPTELAKLLDTTYQTIWRWSSDTEQLPEPILTDTSQARGRPVYHLEEVRVIIRAIGEHLNEYRYYRQSHLGVKDRIFSEIETIREANYGEQNGNQAKRKVQGKAGKNRRSGTG